MTNRKDVRTMSHVRNIGLMPMGKDVFVQDLPLIGAMAGFAKSAKTLRMTYVFKLIAKSIAASRNPISLKKFCNLMTRLDYTFRHRKDNTQTSDLSTGYSPTY